MNRISSVEPDIKVKMFGPALDAKGGISTVVSNWLYAGLDQEIRLSYFPTLVDNTPGFRLSKIGDVLRSYYLCLGVNRRNTDLVHLHLSSHASFYRKFPLFLWSRLRGLRTVVHLHGSEFQQFYAASDRLTRWAICYVFDKSTIVLALSKSWERWIASLAPTANIRVLYNGAPADLYDTKSEPVEPQGDTVFLFMGRLGKRKGTYDLLDAFQRLVGPERISAVLVLGGDGDVEQVRQIIADNDLEDRVRIAGWLSGEEKISAFRNCDIFVLPSYNEGVPGAMLEAMACGKAVISTPVGGIEEVIENGHNGFLITPGDVDALTTAMKCLAEDSSLRAKMGEQNKKILLEKYDSRIIVKKLLAVYSDAMLG